MRAFVLLGPREGRVEEVPAPVPGPDQVVVDVERVGLCGTDVEFYTGEMTYLHEGHASYPMRLGHEWCGTVARVGDGVDRAWLGRRVTGDTMLGCGRCHRCRSGRQHVCGNRYEIGIRGGWPGALAEQLLVPARALHTLPDSVDAATGAMVEPGGNSLRAADAAEPGPGRRILIWGPGTIGLLAAQFALARGAEVHVVGRDEPSLRLPRQLGVDGAWTAETLPDLPYSAVIDATFGVEVPRTALEIVEPGGRLVFIGLAGEPSLIDTRNLVFKDVTAVGILSGSPGLSGAIELYGSSQVDPRPLVAATVGLASVGEVLAGWRPADAGPGPKVHVDPRR